MVLALLASLVLGGRTVAEVLAGQAVGPWSVSAVAPYLGCTAALSCAALVLVALHRRLPPRARVRLLVVVVLADLLLFSADQSSFAPVRARALDPAATLGARLAARVGPQARFVVVDPQRAGGEQLDELGAPDLDALDDTASAQGYGSLVWAPYQAATGSHGQDVVEPAALAGATFDELGVRLLLAVAGDFTRPVARDAAGTAAAGPSWSLPAGTTSTRYFGADEPVAALRIGLPPSASHAEPLRGAAPALAALARRARLLGPAGRPVEVALRARRAGHGAVELFPARRVRASGLMFEPATTRGAGSLRVVVTVLVTGGARLALDGPLAADVEAPHWVLDGSIGPYALLEDTRAEALDRLEPAQGARRGDTVGPSRLVGGAVSALTGGSSVTVDAASALQLVRAVADIPGWHATLRTGSTSRPLPIERDGLVQEVNLPRGHDKVTFTYTAPGLAAGLTATGAGTVMLLLLVGWAWSRWRVGRRRQEVDDASGAG